MRTRCCGRSRPDSRTRTIRCRRASCCTVTHERITPTPAVGERTPVLRTRDAYRRHDISHKANGVSIQVGARLTSRAAPAVICNEVGHILVFEKMVVAFDIELESRVVAEIGDGYAGSALRNSASPARLAPS